MSKFKVGDRVKRNFSVNDNFNKGDVGTIVSFDLKSFCNVNIKMDINGMLSSGNSPEYLTLIEQEKLINEKTMENLEDFDKKALSDAKKEIAVERAEIQKEKAKEILRRIMKDKDEAEEVIRLAEGELEEIDESLKVFNAKK